MGMISLVYNLEQEFQTVTSRVMTPCSDVVEK
jgi:hypothetical protein